MLKDTVSELLGRPGDKALAQELYRVIREEPMVLNAADMMLHNYGPDAYSGSVNIEIDCGKTVEEVYSDIHALQLRIMHEYHVTMVFGIYAVNNDREAMKEMRGYIARFVRSLFRHYFLLKNRMLRYKIIHIEILNKQHIGGN